MNEHLGPLERLIDELGKLPGIGQKSATRLAFFLLQHPVDDALALADSIIEVKKNIQYCSNCWNVTTDDPCAICQDSKRDQSVICVVEQPQELLAIERTAEYRGVYHVLMGAISPLNGIGPEDLTIDSLVNRAQQEDIEEVILATNPTNDGETTATYIQKALQDTGVTVSRIAQGLPVGSNLEHVDNVTMVRSILTRRRLSQG